MSNGDMRDGMERRESPAEETEIGAFEALWTFFSSMKTAIALLLILSAVAIVGTVVEDKTRSEQNPSGVSIYHTTWFSMLLVLVGVNLAVCSINRFGLVWRRAFNPDVEVTTERVGGMQRSETFNISGTVDGVVNKVVHALRSRSYHVFKQSGSNTISLYAARGRAGVWGPHLTHISLLVIFAGAVYGSKFGSEGYTTIVEDKRTAAYHLRGAKDPTPLGFEVALRSFTIKHDKNHNPTGYKSDLQVYDGGKAMTQMVVDVNHPLTYRGLSFYQSDYGLVGLVMKVEGANGTVNRIGYNVSSEDTAEGRKYGISDQPFRQLDMGGKRLTLFVHHLVPDYVPGSDVDASSLPLNPAVNVMASDLPTESFKDLPAWAKNAGQLGWLQVGKPIPYKGYNITLEKVVSYTGLQVSRNPGLPVVYLGFALMVLGVILSFYVTHKVIRVCIVPMEGGVRVAVGAMSAVEPDAFDGDFKRLRAALA